MDILEFGRGILQKQPFSKVLLARSWRNSNRALPSCTCRCVMS